MIPVIKVIKPSVKVGYLHLARTAAFLLVIAVFTGACSSGTETLTLDEYFAELEAIDADVDSQFEAMWAEFPEGDEDEDPFANEANLEPFKDLVAGFPRIFGAMMDSAKELDPPPEVEDAHNDLTDAGEVLLAAFEAGVDVMVDAETMAEFQTLEREVGSSVDAAEAAFDAACLSVVDVAIAEDINVTITCEDE